jgi:hypothetical protein
MLLCILPLSNQTNLELEFAQIFSRKRDSLIDFARVGTVSKRGCSFTSSLASNGAGNDSGPFCGRCTLVAKFLKDRILASVQETKSLFVCMGSLTLDTWQP